MKRVGDFLVLGDEAIRISEIRAVYTLNKGSAIKFRGLKETQYEVSSSTPIDILRAIQKKK